MKSLKTIAFALLLFCVCCVGVTSAETHIPAGAIDKYNITVANETYIIDGDVFAPTTAIQVKASNVTIDGQYHNITFASNGTGYGIFQAVTTLNNTTIKNISFIQTNVSATNTYGIYYSSAQCKDIIVANCTANVQSSSGNGVYLYNGGPYNVYNSTFFSNANYGIRIRSVSNSTFVDITGASNTNQGINIDTCNNITLRNCIGASNASYGAVLKTVTNSTVANITANSQTSNNVYSGFYAYLGSTNNTFDDIRGASSIGKGIYIDNCTNNALLNCTGNSDSSYGLYITNAAANNLTNCSGVSNSSQGLYITNGTGNIFTSCDFASSTSWAIRFTTSTNTYVNINVTSPLAYTGGEGTKVLMIGDSITAGGAGGVVPLGAWRNVFESTLDEYGTYSVSDVGWSGETAENATARFEQELDIYDPDIITVMYGTNDIAHGRSTADIVNDITWMKTTAESRGITPYMLLVTASSVNNTQKLWLNENLSASFNVINVYDVIDAIPENGAYDGYNSEYYVDGDHPNIAGNELLGAYIARNLLSPTHMYLINSGSSVIYANGTIKNSRNVWSSDRRIDAMFVPNTDNVIVNISTWDVNRKVWNESSDIHDTITNHTIGDFPANTQIQLNVDGVKEADFISDANGQIEFAFTGYSEHTFEAFVISGEDFDIARHNAASTWSSSIALLIAIVIIIFSGLLLAAVRGTLSMPLLTNAVIGLMILTLVVLAGAGILSSFEGLI